MKKAIVLDTNDVKALIAKEYDIPLENVFKAQYTFVVTLEEEEPTDE